MPAKKAARRREEQRLQREQEAADKEREEESAETRRKKRVRRTHTDLRKIAHRERKRKRAARASDEIGRAKPKGVLASGAVTQLEVALSP